MSCVFIAWPISAPVDVPLAPFGTTQASAGAGFCSEWPSCSSIWRSEVKY
jgi:hypothetical protein